TNAEFFLVVKRESDLFDCAADSTFPGSAVNIFLDCYANSCFMLYAVIILFDYALDLAFPGIAAIIFFHSYPILCFLGITVTIFNYCYSISSIPLHTGIILFDTEQSKSAKLSCS